jgi:prevent-host-death family protein
MSSSTAISQLPSVSATDIKNAFASVWDRMIAEGAVAITKHEKPKAVLLSVERFEELVRSSRPALDQLTEEFDSLLAGLQSTKARRGMASAFKAGPDELGRSAVSAARKRK